MLPLAILSEISIQQNPQLALSGKISLDIDQFCAFLQFSLEQYTVHSVPIHRVRCINITDQF